MNEKIKKLKMQTNLIDLVEALKLVGKSTSKVALAKRIKIQ